MARLNGYLLSAGMLEEAKRILENTKGDGLLKYAIRRPQLFPGYRLDKGRAKQIRTRLQELLGSSFEIDSDLQRMLAVQGLTQSLLTVLSEMAIEVFAKELMAAFGKDRVLLALLLDSRENVVKIAGAFLEREEDAPPLPSREEAIQGIREGLGPFFSHMKEFISGDSPPRREPVLSPSDKNEKETKVKELGERLKQKMEEEEKLQKELKALRKEKAVYKGRWEQVSAEMAEKARRIDDLDRLLKESRSKNERAEKDLAERVHRLSDEKVQQLKETWLAVPLKVTDHLERTAGRTENLLDRVDRALKWQLRDTHYSNVTQLRQQHLKLQEALGKVREARLHCLNPIKELGLLEKELLQELGEIEEVLAPPVPHEDYSATALHGEITKASSLERLDDLSELLFRLQGEGLLRPENVQVLNSACTTRAALLYDSFPYDPLLKSRFLSSDSVSILRWALKLQKPVLVLVDGYNVLLGLPHYKEFLDQKGRPGERARERLLRSVKRLFNHYRGCDAHVYFDGTAAAEEKVTENVKVVFCGSRNKDEHRADEAICGYLEFASRNPSYAVTTIVVSGDRELCREASHLGAMTLSPDLFYNSFLQNTE